MIPVTDELLADMEIDISDFLLRQRRWTTAIDEGRLMYRGGGWWRLDAETYRGRNQVWEAV